MDGGKRILVVSATELEVSEFIGGWLEGRSGALAGSGPVYLGGGVWLLVGGVGLLSMLYSVTAALSRGEWDYVIQVGFSGLYDFNSEGVNVGDCVLVGSERIWPYGVRRSEGLVPLGSVGLWECGTSENVVATSDVGVSEVLGIPLVDGVTVLVPSGDGGLAGRMGLDGACVESMEGIALPYVAGVVGVSVASLRVVSNSVVEGDGSGWRVDGLSGKLSSELYRLVECVQGRA